LGAREARGNNRGRLRRVARHVWTLAATKNRERAVNVACSQADGARGVNFSLIKASHSDVSPRGKRTGNGEDLFVSDSS